ncbi:Gly-X carboxypeptidase [Coprinopsis cinerea AmutBmut pab1-1]|nr:Gly-X carboxypeptidase [Coprinopsis cinerea AmutBmut pab1-1]
MPSTQLRDVEGKTWRVPRRGNVVKTLLLSATACLATIYCVTVLDTGGALHHARTSRGISRIFGRAEPEATTDNCPQPPAIRPTKHADLWANLSAHIGTDMVFRQHAIEWLSGAIQIQTETFDGMGPIDEDPRWKVFEPFHEYLLNTFPLVHASLKLTKVNTYGLLYEWVGSDTSLKPILFLAHQDVVPAGNVSQWTHPPYSGHYDGQLIWGRGSLDDKAGVIGTLAAVETLLQNNFSPTRTVLLSFGFDEEISGFLSAGTLAPFIKEIYGKNGVAMVIDEGPGFSRELGTWLATPGVAEKGFMNVKLEIRTPGGHASVPPPHTSIGMLAALLVKFEDSPVKAELTRDHPVYWTLQCKAEHAKEIPDDLRNTIKQAAHSDQSLRDLESIVFQSRVEESIVGLTQAIDVIQGGVKANVLPEQAWAVINHRVPISDSVSSLKERNTNLVVDLAKRFNLTFTSFGQEILSEADVGTPKGSLIMEDLDNSALEPAPITPISGLEAGGFVFLSGTIKGAFEAWSKAYHSNEGFRGEDEEIIIAPSMMSANTDTRWYWDLSKNIFRYNHVNQGANNGTALSSGIHTVNERVAAETYLEMIHFFATLILNADESTSL